MHALLIFGARSFFAVGGGGHPVQCEVLSSIPSLHHPDASSPCSVVTAKNVFRHHQMFRGKQCLYLRTFGLDQGNDAGGVSEKNVRRRCTGWGQDESRVHLPFSPPPSVTAVSVLYCLTPGLITLRRQEKCEAWMTIAWRERANLEEFYENGGPRGEAQCLRDVRERFPPCC